jgi:hypothetical protein
MQNVMLQDVCEVFIKDLDNGGKQYFFGLTTKTDITQKLKQDMLKGGIGNGVVGVVQAEKEITFKVSTLLHNDPIFEIQSGTTFANGTITAQKNEQIVCTQAGKVTLTGTPKTGTTPIVMDAFGKAIVGTFTASAFTATTPADIAVGSTYTALYAFDATGDILSLDSKKFPKNYYVELHTIGYDVNTNKVACDVFLAFNKCLPDGGINLGLESGKNAGDEISFTAQLLAGSSEYGKIAIIPRSAS